MMFQAIAGFRLVTADPARLAAFYRAIGFDVGEAAPIPAAEMELLGPARRAVRASRCRSAEAASISMTSTIRVAPIPLTRPPAISCSSTSRSSPTMWRPHGAARATPARRRSAETGPVTLPKSAGGVTAVKFRDPEGHPLEFLQFPPGANADWKGAGIMGIDHSAISVGDVAASRRFYARHGLSEGGRDGQSRPDAGRARRARRRRGRRRADEPFGHAAACRDARLSPSRRPRRFARWPPTTSPRPASSGGRMARRCSAIPTGIFISSRDKIDRQQILGRGDEQPPSVRAAKGAVRGDRGRRDEAQLAPIRRPDMHAVGRARPHPAARIDRKAVGIAMVGVAEEAPVGERAAFAHVECDDLVLRSGFMSGNLAERQRGVGHIERRAIGGEGEAVGLLEIRHPLQIAGLSDQSDTRCDDRVRARRARPGWA